MFKFQKRIVITMTAALLSASLCYGFELKNLRVNNLTAPLGVDVEKPVFSWQSVSEERGFIQKSYAITVKDDAGNTVWETGEVASDQQNNIEYGGAPLQSCAQYMWTLSVKSTDGSIGTASSSFETAFLHNEWTAKWICKQEEENLAKMVITLDEPVECQYVRLHITKLGARAAGDAGYSFAQLSEMEIYSGDENLALNATFTSNSSWTVGNWNLKYINDGKLKDAGALGWTTTQNPTLPVYVTAKFAEKKTVDKIVLYARQDDHAVNDPTHAANFPASFNIRTSNNGSSYTTRFTATNVEAPKYYGGNTNVPYYGRNFTVDEGKTIKRARMYASALGIFTMKLNGRKVTENVLEPGESQYEKCVLYSVYDVTGLVKPGKNSLLAQVAGGIFNITKIGANGGLTQRYSKGELSNSGESALKAQLLIEYTDGTSERVITDTDWKSHDSATTGSNWWGGEDYDARMAVEGLDAEDFDFSDWMPVREVSPTFMAATVSRQSIGKMVSRMYQPLRVVETWSAVEVKSIKSGGKDLYVVDFGRNYAGQYRFHLKGKSGQVITLRPGESLNKDGSVVVANWYTSPWDNYDCYTFSGNDEGETWGPEFMYHGARYLQIIGLEEAPSPEDFTAMRIRSDMENIGRFESSNTLLNQIHVICRDAIASQLYNTITDCPGREKLGWLDVPNEMFNSLSFNFDMAAFYNKVTLDCFDAQYANGRVPSTVPHYASIYDDDPNWGGAAILVPYRTWKMYGDKTPMKTYYSQMCKLIDYYTSLTNGTYIMPGSSYSVLSDWGQGSAGLARQVPGEFTITTTYYFLATAMAEMAAELGLTANQQKYSQLAENIKKAFNKRFYNASTGVYEYGNQAEYGMALYYGLVDEENEAAVAEKLAQAVINANYKIKTGEIALKTVLMSLAKYGRNDIVYEMANQTDYPSYGYWVMQGCTTTPEYWDMSYSQNHCMMDHIEEWFYSELGGIKNSGEDAYHHFTIKPYIAAGLNNQQTQFDSAYGQILSSYEKTDNSYDYEFVVPANTSATIIIPVEKGHRVFENGKEIDENNQGVLSVKYEDGNAYVEVLSGSYHFTPGSPTAIQALNEDVRAMPEQFYTLSGIPVDEPGDGIFVQKGKKVFIKKSN